MGQGLTLGSLQRPVGEPERWEDRVGLDSPPAPVPPGSLSGSPLKALGSGRVPGWAGLRAGWRAGAG